MNALCARLPAESGAARTARSASDEQEPPLSNTGVQITGAGDRSPGALGWGWLQGTVRADLADVRALVSRYLGDVEQRDYGARWYECLARVGTRGSALAWCPRAAPESRASEVFVQVVQDDCDALGFDQVAALARELLALGFRCTRADAYYDDRQRHVGPRQVVAAFDAGQRVTHFEKRRLLDDGEDGATAYLGRLGQSDVVVRCYDKDAEQGTLQGEHGIRWEIQARKGRAEWLLRQVLLVDQEQRGQAFAEVLVGLVDFREREGERNGRRAPRLEWWAQLVGDVVAARWVAAKVVDSLARRVRWLRRQVAPTLALVLTAWGGDLSNLVAIAREGERRVTPGQWALLGERLRPQASALAQGV